MIRPVKRREKSTPHGQPLRSEKVAPKIKPQSDLELWEQILAGEQTAWRELVTRYSTLVYNVCTYFGLSYMDAADCFQQTWLQLYRSRRRIKDVSRLSSWLVTTAKRESLRMKAHSSRMVDDDHLSNTADPNPNPDEELVAIERQHKLEYALSMMDPVSRRILEEFFFADEQKSYRDIARALGYAENTLGAKRRRCLKKLQAILQEIGFLEERDQG
jgi:RNA polymerase sigma factor (sigma-70 family)